MKEVREMKMGGKVQPQYFHEIAVGTTNEIYPMTEKSAMETRNEAGQLKYKFESKK